MTSKFARFFMPAVLAASVAALAQNAALPAAPSAAANNAAAPVATNATGTRMGTINVEQAIFATNEGQRDFEALSKKLEPKQNELKGVNDEVEALKKQLNTQGEKLNDDSRAMLVKYAADQGFGVIIDTSNPWPNGPVLWAGPAVDITKSVVDLYNAQSGVAAPARPATARPTTPSATRPATTAPAAPKAPTAQPK